MTDTARIARGWALIAEGAQEISLAYEAIEQPAAGSGAPPPARSAPADYDEDPSALFDDAPQAAETPSAAPLGACPAHRTAWTVKAGGISKNGKPYPPFWKCSGKNDDGSYCNLKPEPGWSKAHPIPLEAVA
jgi:hypothetical protein